MGLSPRLYTEPFAVLGQVLDEMRARKLLPGIDLREDVQADMRVFHVRGKSAPQTAVS